MVPGIGLAQDRVHGGAPPARQLLGSGGRILLIVFIGDKSRIKVVRDADRFPGRGDQGRIARAVGKQTTTVNSHRGVSGSAFVSFLFGLRFVLFGLLRQIQTLLLIAGQQVQVRREIPRHLIDRHSVVHPVGQPLCQ